MCRAYAFWWVCKWARKSCNSWLEYHNSWWLIVILLVVRISRTRSLSKDTCLCSCMLSVSLLLLLLLLLVLLSVIMIDSFDWFCLLVLLFYLFGLFVILLNFMWTTACWRDQRFTVPAVVLLHFDAMESSQCLCIFKIERATVKTRLYCTWYASEVWTNMTPCVWSWSCDAFQSHLQLFLLFTKTFITNTNLLIANNK